MNPRTTNRFTGWKMGAMISFTCALPLLAEEVDVSKLPAPATVQVDYARDILPILENSCLRCHGAEKPKGDFRLTSRENALKAGDYGANIVPGDSAKSPLIHYVARLVTDMEMPPEGKGDPLTPEQVALLRAWIDQDVNWPETKIDTTPTVSIWPTLRYITVDGNENRFRQHTGLNPGWAGGVEYFRYDQQLDADRKVTMEGHAIGGEESYGVTITLEKRDVGFIRGGAEQYRRYYADTGGYYEPFGLGTPSLGRELYIDVGKAWIEFGLTRPDQPKITLGYEYHYRDGDKSLTGWGPHSDLGTFETRNINPSYKGVDEDVHILRLDLTHDIGGYAIEDNFRAEFYDLTTQRYETYSSAPSPAPPDLTYQIQERHDHFQAANALRAEKQLRDWLLVSGGYLYSYLDGEAFFQRDAVFPGGAPFIAPYSNELLIEQHSHVFNLNAQLGPWEGLTFAAGVQSEWMRQEGLGEVVLDGVTPARLDSNLDRVAWDESFVLRYTTLPYTVLFAETRFQQESIGQAETEADNGGFSDFMRDTDASSDLKEYLAGFQVSPWQRISFTAQYKHRLKQNEYSDNLDESDPAFNPSGNGYSAFITDRDITRDELELKLTARPTSWLKTTLSYEISATDYDTATDSAVDFGGTVVAPGGWVYAGNQDAHTYGLSLVLTPWRRFYVTGALTWQDTRLAAEANGVPSVVPYSGDVYSVLGNATYVLNDKTDLRLGYAFSRADYRQDNVTDGLPVGIEYDWHRIQFGITRHLRRNMTTNLQYAYHHYDEPTSGDANNYRAHLVFATLTIFLP